MSNTTSQKASIISKNTLALFARMLLTIIITLYTSRVFLDVLGVEDFGVLNVIGGAVTLMSFISSSLATATQRFLSYEAGLENAQGFQNIFNLSILIYAVLAIFIMVSTGVLGTLYVENYMVIDPSRVEAASWVLFGSVISFGFAILSTPYISLLITKEDMKAYALIHVFDVILKLAIAISLSFFTSDSLKAYAVLLALLSIIIYITYYLYCTLKYTEARFSFYWEKSLFFKLLDFSAWSLFGSFASVCFNQGVNILLNVFFGPSVNAARAISYQVNSAMKGFIVNIQMAINPQIIKSYASGDQTFLLQLISLGTRLSFYLSFLFIMPLILNMELILSWWLVETPAYTVIFCKLILIDTAINSLSGGLQTGIQATGKIRLYQIVVGGMLLLNVPISYFFLEAGYSSDVVFVVTIVLSISALFSRLFILQLILSYFKVKDYIKNVLIDISKVAIFSLLIHLLILEFTSFWRIERGFLFLVESVFISICSLSFIWLVGLKSTEKKYFMKQIDRLKK